ncbi:RICIN domain-containing protein [Kitasatospora sp. NPDC059648]|uniref:RICIN domain-containing protein n=1 Tax=Kitasatospora sp. NPDC059648 TaxID=3346894 RepID=UPI0036C4B1A7
MGPRPGSAYPTPAEDQDQHLWAGPGNATPNQIFVPRPDGSLHNPASGRCAGLSSGVPTNGTRLQLWDCNGTAAQKWTALVRS